MANLAQMSEQAQQQLTAGHKEVKMKELVQEPISGQNMELKKMRVPRSRKYIKAIEQAAPLIETGEEMKTAVESLPASNKLRGILSECGIPGCIIHAIDKWGNILRHYTTPEEISPELREGYDVWENHRGCISVEVYTFTICIIYDDGTVKIVEKRV